MQIFKNEFIKVFLRKSTLLLIVSSIIINAVLLYVNENIVMYRERFYPSKSYKKICADLSGMSDLAALDYLKKQYAKLELYKSVPLMEQGYNFNSDMLAEIDINEALKEYNSGSYLKYCNNIWSESYLYRDLILELENCVNYEGYLESIDKAAENTAAISLFADPDSFSYKNIMKTPKDFAHLKGIRLKFAPSYGVKMATEAVATDLIGILLIIYMVVILLTREKELSQLVLVRTTAFGRERLALAKLSVACLASAVIVTLLYGTNLILAYNTYGFGELNRYLQSVQGYTGSSLKITVLQYFTRFYLTKMMVYVFIASLVFFIAAIAKEALQLYFLLTAIFSANAIFYFNIAPSSYLSIFKYINIFSFIKTDRLFGNYLNINIFGNPVNYIPIFYAAVLTVIILSSILAVYVLGRQNAAEGNGMSLTGRLLEKTGAIVLFKGRTVSVFWHECYKILIGGKALLLMLLFLILTLITYKPMKESLRDINDLYYKQYMLMLEGEINEEKLNYLNEEEKRFIKAANDMMQKLSQDGDNSGAILEYQKILAPRQAFETVKEHTAYLLENKKRHFLYDTGYKLLTGADTAANKDMQLALIAQIMLIACLVYVYTVEYQSGIAILQRTSINGRGRTFICKFVLSVLIITFIYIVTYFPYYYNVFTTYGIRDIFAPANSMEHLSAIPVFVSILEYLIYVAVARYFSMLLSALIIFILSIKLKSYIAAILASAALLILPILISMLGVSWFRYVLLNPFFIGNVF